MDADVYGGPGSSRMNREMASDYARGLYEGFIKFSYPVIAGMAAWGLMELINLKERTTALESTKITSENWDDLKDSLKRIEIDSAVARGQIAESNKDLAELKLSVEQVRSELRKDSQQ
jgi:hypothetical protein